MLMDSEALQKAVRDVVGERFTGAEIVSVEIEDDVDSDGDEILRVTVVLEAEKLEARKLSGFLRHLRSRLTEVGETKFPVTTFMSRSDAESLSPAAA